MVVDYATDICNEIEIGPGIKRRLTDCTVEDLQCARTVEAQKETVRTEVELLIAEAAQRATPIPDELRERAALWHGDLRELCILKAELAEWVLQAV